MRIERVGIAQVKGTRHESVPAAPVDASGLPGDRAVALVDPATGATCKSVDHGVLVRVRGRVDADGVRVTLPGGDVVAQPLDGGRPAEVTYWGRPVATRLLDGPVAAALSDLLGRRVLLAPSVRRADYVWDAPVSVVRRSEVEELAARAGRPDLADPDLLGRYRSNLVLDDADKPLDGTPGTLLTCGDVVLEVTGEIDRCAVMDHHPFTGEPDAPVMKVLATYRRTPAGVMLGLKTRVLRPGTLRAGDPVRTTPPAHDPRRPA